MKLLLTSQGTLNKNVMDEMIRLIGKDPKDTNLLFITTAVNAVDIDRRGYFYNELERLKEAEFKIKEYDLVEKSQSDIENEVKKSDVVFVSGGQPFYLLDVIRKCNFREIILKLLKNKIYVGSSAGSYIACPSVEMGLWKKPERDTYGLKDFKGMGLVDFMVFAHYDDIYKDFIEEKRKEIPMKIYELTDNQAISIEGGSFKFIN